MVWNCRESSQDEKPGRRKEDGDERSPPVQKARERVSERTTGEKDDERSAQHQSFLTRRKTGFSRGGGGGAVSFGAGTLMMVGTK